MLRLTGNWRRAGVALLSALTLAAPGGCGLLFELASGIATAVTIEHVAGLAAPAVSGTKAYAFERWFAIDPAQPSDGEATSFILGLRVFDPARVRMRLHDTQAGSSQELTYLATSPSDAEQVISASGPLLDDDIRESLRNGQGVFWCADTEHAASLDVHRFAVVAPRQVLSAFNSLEVFQETDSAGLPVAGDFLELVDGFFYMASLGDSVAIGNGLYDDQKYPNLVARIIQQRTQRKVIHQFLAVSGAHVLPGGDRVCGPDCYREAPGIPASVYLQAQTVEQPEVQDLILMNGCLNDLGFQLVLGPDTTMDEIASLSEIFCGDVMEPLLHQIAVSSPRAQVVLTGYYPAVSEASNAEPLQLWLRQFVSDQGATIEQLRDFAALHSDTFVGVSEAAMQRAVAGANALLADGDRVMFVDPGFGPQNAIFAPESWLFGVTLQPRDPPGLFIQLEVLPEDPKLAERIDICNSLAPATAFRCYYTSVGHPNPRGAEAYAAAIVSALEAAGILPAAGQ